MNNASNQSDLNSVLKELLKKEKIELSTSQDNNEVKIYKKPNSINLRLVSPEEERQSKLESTLYTLKLKNDKLAIENEALKTDNALKLHFAWFVILLLFIQTIVVFIFIFIHHKIFNSYCLTTLIMTIIGQSYFLPSFVAKYLFKNNGNTSTVEAIKKINV